MEIPYIEAEIDEIFPNSDLRFYDPRRTENNTLFWVKPSGKIHPSYIIYQEFSSPEFPEEKVLSPIKEFRDQIECIGHIARFLARNSLGIEAKNADFINILQFYLKKEIFNVISHLRSSRLPIL